MPWKFDGQALKSPLGQQWAGRNLGMSTNSLPKGSYTIGTPAIASDWRYRDSAEFGWWCPINASMLSFRRGLGIHPDDGTLGREGYIGITAPDTRSCFEALKTTTDRVLTIT